LQLYVLVNHKFVYCTR